MRRKHMKGQELLDTARRYLADRDYENARKFYLQASEQGNFFATYDLGCMYYFGDGVERDEAAAFDWFSKAAGQGDPEATNRVGVMLEQGIGTAPDVSAAFDAYLRSARMGSLSGMANVAACYLAGKGTDADVPLGLDWMEKASEGGNGIASLTLGDYYMEGNYVPRNPAQARLRYQRGIGQKYAPAIRKLAELYQKGLGGPQSDEEAARLFRLADETPDED